MKKILILFFVCIFLSGCTNVLDKNTKLTWGMLESQVRKSQKISKENQTISVDSWSWINCNDQNIFGCVGKITYHFDNSKLTDIDFIPHQINSVEEMNKIYKTLKDNISLEYGNPTIDEVQISESAEFAGLEYHYAEWNIENTLIRLQDNKDALHISLDFNSLDYLKGYEQSQETNATTNNKYKTNGEWSLSASYAFAIENDTYNGDIYSAGEYTFKTTNTTFGEAPMYDIYIEKSEYNSMNELGSIDYTVGGAGSFPITITLSKGDYVYIVPYSDLLYEPKGYLTFEIKN